MPRVKILVDFKPAEGYKVGDIVDMTNPWKLVDEGKVVLVDEKGGEMERPGLLHCPICPFIAKTALDLASHIIDSHPKKAAQPAARRLSDRPDQKTEAKEGLPPEEALAKVEKMGLEKEELSDEKAVAQKEKARRQRLLNLEKARAVRTRRLEATKAKAEKGKKVKSA